MTRVPFFNFGNGRVALIGGGDLGATLAQRIVSLPGYPQEEKPLCVMNRSDASFERLGAARDSVCCTTDLQEAQAASTVLLVVPPAAYPNLGIKHHSDQLVVSLMASVSLARIRENGARQIVRVMTTKPLSPIAWVASPEVASEGRGFIEALFGALGVTAELQTEEQIDFFTALFGTGLGWLAFLQSSLITIAIDQDIPPDQATRLVAASFLSTAQHFVTEGAISPIDYIVYMMQYSGVTTEFIQALQDGGLKGLFSEAVQRAMARVRSLGGGIQ